MTRKNEWKRNAFQGKQAVLAKVPRQDAIWGTGGIKRR